MGFPLPVFGYVAQRGHHDIHDRENECGGWNLRNRNAVEIFMKSLRDVYPLCPAPGRFVFPWGSEDRLTFGDVRFETSNHNRPTLKALLTRLQGGGTLIVTDLEHLLDTDPASVQLMLDHQGSRVAFLDLNRAPVELARNVEDVDLLIKHLMDNYSHVKRLVSRRAAAFGLRPLLIEA